MTSYPLLLTQLSLLALLSMSLSACKIAVSVPTGGYVSATNGLRCEAGQVCEVAVQDTQFDHTFTAHAAPGYRFSHWRRDHRFFCGDSTTPCRLATSGFAGNAALLAFLGRDDETFHLQPVFEADESNNLSYWRQVTDDINNNRYTGADFLYDKKPDIGNCDPGMLSDAAKTRALDATNAVRALVGLPPVALDNNFSDGTQQAALIQQANHFLSHNPPMDALCYTAAGDAAAGSANLSLSSRTGDPAYNVFGWANDNFNVSTLAAAGHRRWVLFPQLGYISYGQVDGAAVQKVFRFNRGNNPVTQYARDYVAFPYGSFPYLLVSKGNNPTPWSLSIIPPGGNTAHDYFSGASVTVTNDNTGQALQVHSLHHDTSGYGLRNFFSWMVDGWEYDTDYTVDINGITQPDGSERHLRYAVRINRQALLE